MQGLFFGLMFLVMLLQVGDYITTVKAITEFGAVEKNPLNRFLFKKIGMPATTFAEVAVLLVMGCFLASQDLGYGVMFTSIVGGMQAFNLVRGIINYRKLKNKKV